MTASSDAYSRITAAAHAYYRAAGYNL